MNANNIIESTLRKLLVTSPGVSVTTEQYADGLENLNDMIDSWSAEGDLTYEDTFEELAIPAGTQTITIGASGTLVTARPLEINLANLKEGTTEYELRLIDEREYSSIDDKTTSGLPYALYYRNTWPNGTIYFDSATDKAYTLVLTSRKQLSTFPDGTTEISLPDYYKRALKSNLCIEWADELGAGKNVSQLMMHIAKESKDIIIGQATDVVPSQIELRSRKQYNIESDE